MMIRRLSRRDEANLLALSLVLIGPTSSEGMLLLAHPACNVSLATYFYHIGANPGWILRRKLKYMQCRSADSVLGN